jgi:hypothetical protein
MDKNLYLDIQIFSFAGIYHLFERFSNYSYFKTDSSDLPLILISKKQNYSPFSIESENIDLSSLKRLEINKNFVVIAGKKFFRPNLYLYDSKFSLNLKELYSNAKVKAMLEEKISFFQKKIRPFILAESKIAFDFSQNINLKELLGKGEGLTPAGSDFLIGYNWISHQLKSSDYPVFEFSNIFTSHLYFLFQHNLLPQFLHGFLHYIFSDTPLQVDLFWRLFRKAMQFGSSSGIAIIEGIIFFLRENLSFAYQK